MRRILSLAALVLLLSGAFAWSAQRPRPVLSRTLPDVNFNAVPLRQCFEFISDSTGANLHVNWNALGAAGITPETPVTMRMRSVSVRKVLNMLLAEAAAGQGTLAFYVDEGIVEITTREISDRQLITRVYAVDDLLFQVPDFDDAPDFSLNSGTNNNNSSNTSGTGTSGSSTGLFGSSSSSSGSSARSSGSSSGTGGTNTKTKEEMGQDLVKLIEDVIQPTIWDTNGGPASIRFWRNSLIVTAPRSIHEALAGVDD
jgi:hypothetical protein